MAGELIPAGLDVPGNCPPMTMTTAERLALALSAADLGIWQWDIATNKFDYSTRAKTICGFEPGEDITYERVAAVTHPDDFPHTSGQAKRALDPMIRDRSPYEYRIVRPDGAVRWVVAHGYAVFDESKTPPVALQYIGTIQDITDRKAAQEAELANAQKLRLAMDAARLAVWSLDMRTGEVAPSGQLNQLFGFPQEARPTLEELRSRSDPKDLETLSTRGSLALERRERGFDGNAALRLPDGGRRWVTLRCEYQYDKTGAPERAVGVVIDVTEERMAQQALRESDARFREAADSAPAPVWMTNRAGQIEFVNQAMALFAGVDPSELMGDAWLRSVHPEDVPVVGARRAEAWANGHQAYRVEARFRRADGAWRWMEVSSKPRRDGAGEFHGYVGLAIDKTDEKETLATLRQSESRLLFLDQIGRAMRDVSEPDVIMTIVTRLTAEHLNGAVCAYADMDPDEDGFTIRGDYAVPGAASIRGHYSLRDFGARAVSELRAGRPLISHDNAKESQLFLQLGLHATICMPLIKNGKLTALMAIHNGSPRTWHEDELALLYEVTDRCWAHIERVRSEAHVRELLSQSQEKLDAAVAERIATLKQNEQRMRTIFETSHQNQGLLTPEGRLIYANKTALDSIESDLEDVLGKEFWDTPWFAGTPGAPEAVRTAVLKAAGGSIATADLSLVLPTGHRRYEFSMRPVFDEGGTVVALVPEAVETTARVKAEDALRQAQKMEAMGQLTGGVAHDFNNLLMVISGGLSILDRREDPEHRAMIVARMREAVERGSNLTRQLLAFARRQELNPEVIDFAEYATSLRELLDRSLGPNVRVAIDIGEDLAPIYADQTGVQLAILNLAVNARDAMVDGGVVTISAKNGSPSNPDAPCVTIAVSDTGTGMTPAVQKRIFEPFFTTKDTGKGSGLGLSQVHGFAEQSGGQIEVRSKPGAGTTMMLVLPRSDEVSRTSPKPAIRAAKRQPRTQGNVLLVEDDDEVAALTGEMLEILGWSVTRVGGAAAALGALSNGREIDLVFSDVMMPGGMSGLDLAREIRNRRPDLRVVLASGYAEAVKRDADEALIPLLPKPFDLDSLAAIIAYTR